MKRIPIICDECLSPRIRSYLQHKGLNAYSLRKRLPDKIIKDHGYRSDAYILTADLSFNDYRNALFVQSNAEPWKVYSMIKTLLDMDLNGA